MGIRLIAIVLCAALPARAEAPTAAMVEKIFAEVESVRGLQRKAPVKVELLEDKEFIAALHGHADAPPKEKLEAMRAGWIALGLAPADVDPLSLFNATADEHILGFYSPRSKRLCVRKRMPKREHGDAGADLRHVIAHELQHALQDQNFTSLAAAEHIDDEDQALALRALIEGDAEATALAVEAKRAGRPIGYTMAMTAIGLRSLSLEELVRRSGHSAALLKMPPVIRETMLMPYTSGLALVSDIYRRGGFALVDRAFAHPPITSHQVLHPESYFSGEQPAVIEAPKAPEGARVIETGTLGELGTRVVLETCVEPHVVRTFSDGWRGDRYTLFESPQHALGIVWRSSWNEGEGDGIAKMLRSQQSCWRGSASARSRDGFSIDALYKARNARDRVALVRGFPRQKLDFALNDAVDFHPGFGAPVPPLGAQSVPRADLKPDIQADKFTSPRLGLSGDIPDGMDAEAQPPPGELVLKGDRAFAALFLVPERYNASNVKFFIDTEVLILTYGTRLPLQSERPFSLAGHTGTRRIWAARNASLSIAAVPACGGAAYEVIVALQASPAAKEKLARFTSSLSPAGPAGACADLKN